MIIKAKNWDVRATAYVAMSKAIYNGEITRKDRCESCACESKRPLHGHHHDYAKPLDVVWLCARCHSAIHRSSDATKSVRLPVDVHEALRREAFERKVTIVEVLAQAIREEYGITHNQENPIGN